MKKNRCACGEKLPPPPLTGRRPRYCVTCAQARKRAAKVKSKQRRFAHRVKLPPEVIPQNNPGVTMSQEQVAIALGLEADAVRAAESSALRKFRARPDVLEVWRDWVEAGKPMPLMQDVGHTLLDYYDKIAKWYELQTQLFQIGEVAIGDEVAREIDPFQRRIGAVLQNIH